MITGNAKCLSSLGSSLTLGCLYHGSSLSIISIRSLGLGSLLLLHGNGKLTSCPSTMSVSTEIYSLSSKSSLSWLSFRGRSVSLVSVSTHFISKTINYLSSEICSIFFSFFNEFISWLYLIIFSLQFCNGNSCICSTKIFFRNSLACFLKNPIILIVIIMTPLIH